MIIDDDGPRAVQGENLAGAAELDDQLASEK